MWETSARLLQLLALLQARSDWSGAELAERLAVTPRTVRRDIDRLRGLGYPVDSASGTAGGYRLGTGAKLPPLLIDDDEAVAITIGLRNAATGPVSGIEEASARALIKLEQVLPSRLRDRVTALHSSTVPLDGPQPTVEATAYVSRAVSAVPYRYQAKILMHAPLDIVAERSSPTAGRLEAIDDRRCVLHTGSNSLDELAIDIVAKGIEFEVLDPPELIDHLDGVAGRLTRAAQRSRSVRPADLGSAPQDDAPTFDDLVARHRQELYTHCYRMLGSVQDAEDAVQESLLAAWRGLSGFQGRSSLRTWLYRIATNTCLRLISRRPKRVLSPDYGPPRVDTTDLGEPVTEPIWLEPLVNESFENGSDAGDPENRYVQRESVELAFVAALQHLPGTQRAALILRDVLQYSAAEVAELLDTTPAAVNSALQRARHTVDQRVVRPTQQVELARLGAGGRRNLVDAFVTAWENADVPALVQLLADDARFTMPPLPAWFLGRDDVARFFAERVFATPWRLVPLTVNAQLGFACYAREADGASFTLGAVNALTVRDGKIAEIAGFIDPDLHRHIGLPAEVS